MRKEFLYQGLPILVWVLLVAGSSHAVAILFRPLADPLKIYAQVDGSPNDETWEAVGRLKARFNGRPYLALNRNEMNAVIQTVFSNRDAWGHMALEFSEGFEPRYLGFQPLLNTETSQALVAQLLEHAPVNNRPMLTSFPASFVDNAAWATASGSLPTLRRLPVTGIREEEERALHAAALLVGQQQQWRYQLPPPFGRPIPEGCANCVSAIKRLFELIGYDLDFIPDNGSITTVALRLEQLDSLPLNSLRCGERILAFTPAEI